MLGAEPEVVWNRVATMPGVNHELGPWVRMTAPTNARFDPSVVKPGERLFRSRLLLFGVLPVDYDDLTFLRIVPGREFLERSPMLSASVWEHHRLLVPRDGGCLVIDRVRFVPRLAFAGRAHRLIARAVFRHRHRRLKQWFNSGTMPSPRRRRASRGRRS